MKKLFIIGSVLLLSGLGVSFASQSTLADECGLYKQNPYKTKESSAVYFLTSDCKMMPIESEEKYFSYFDSWDRITLISQEQLASFEVSDLGFTPWGPIKELKNGDVFKIANSTTSIYLYMDGIAYPIESGEVFIENGYEWNWVVDMFDSINTSYRFWSPRSGRKARTVSMDWLPLGVMVRVEGTPEVYVLEEDNGAKVWTWVTDMEDLRARGFNEERIAVVSQEGWDRLQEEWLDQYWCYEFAQSGNPTLRNGVVVPWYHLHLTPGYSTDFYQVSDLQTCQSDT